ncbi:MAG: NIPSNAP family containing protein [Rhodothermaceae bacterium]|nr:NIPSNAP family containing protein [Rhodothermaceae bacterium]MYG70600.1 NIPSNAP family containing protein [Rhodothermaceae bacterium]MYJ44195.1 NIPSNAP family containing protein [Rhodothermaceae bacterium]
MHRRSFMSSIPLAAATTFITPRTDIRQRQYFEMITYHTNIGPRKSRVADFYRDAALPAYGRLGIGPIGVFSPLYGPNDPSLYILVPHQNVETALRGSTLLLDDEEFRRSGASFLNSSLDDPSYVHQERQLMYAFVDMPQIAVPVKESNRIFELRIYESHNVIAGQKKIAMFNEGGEIAIFHKTGLTPVFFGETIFGPRMPNLTYMLGFESMSERDAAWDRFIVDPEWIALRDDPTYADTVSNITDFILRPLPFSQI